MAKRAFDIVMASVLLVLTLPLILLAAALVYVTMGRPVLFLQARIGLNGDRFTIYKLRSMQGEPRGTDWLRDQYRVTPLGQLLRRTRIDELPQLVQVLRGQMSLVGPRPYPVDLYQRLSAEQPGFSQRQAVRPGLIPPLPAVLYRGGDVSRVRETEARYVREAGVRRDLGVIWMVFTQLPGYMRGPV